MKKKKKDNVSKISESILSHDTITIKEVKATKWIVLESVEKIQEWKILKIAQLNLKLGSDNVEFELESNLFIHLFFSAN